MRDIASCWLFRQHGRRIRQHRPGGENRHGVAQPQPAISERGPVSVLALCAVALGVGLPMRQRPAIASVHDETRVIPVVMRRPVAAGAPAQSAGPPCADPPGPAPAAGPCIPARLAGLSVVRRRSSGSAWPVPQSSLSPAPVYSARFRFSCPACVDGPGPGRRLSSGSRARSRPSHRRLRRYSIRRSA